MVSIPRQVFLAPGRAARFRHLRAGSHLLPEVLCYDASVADVLLAAIMEPLLNVGTVLATVPVTNIQAGGASCYLVSLAGLDVDPFDLDED